VGCMDEVAIIVVAYRVSMVFHHDRNAPTRLLNHQLDCAACSTKIDSCSNNKPNIVFSLILR